MTASAQDVGDFLPPGSNVVTVPPTSAEYYRAVVQAFARGTATTLDGDQRRRVLTRAPLRPSVRRVTPGRTRIRDEPPA